MSPAVEITCPTPAPAPAIRDPTLLTSSPPSPIFSSASAERRSGAGSPVNPML
jgi:hypothetical protein